MPITLPAGVTFTVTNGEVSVKGAKGELKRVLHPAVEVVVEGSTVTVGLRPEAQTQRNLWGLTRTLLNNMVEGVSKGFERKLEIIGVGYKAVPAGSKLTLSLGFSHNIDFAMPAGITVEADKDNKNMICLRGVDKELLGETAAKIRSYRSPEPYKGKGVKYLEEKIQRKAGKTGGK